MSFSTFIREVRKEKSLTQTELAIKLGISKTAIKFIENGTTKFPGEKVLRNLSDYLNVSDLDVITDILFTEEKVEKSHEHFLAYRYLAFMYLKGFNINQAPYVYTIYKSLQRVYDGKLVKKRDSKNTILVTDYERYLYRITEVRDDGDAAGYIGDIISLTLSVLDDYRYLHILFDSNNEEHVRVFNLMKEVRYRKWSFDISVILFDPISGNIIEEETVTIK